MTPTQPTPIAPDHDYTDFASGTTVLDDWLKRRALANQVSGASRSYVSCAGNQVVGYHALAAGSIAIAEARGSFSRNMPDPVPVILLARLAVDRKWQGKGLGRGLFRDAIQRFFAASDIVGARGLIVHAISDEAREFYLEMGMSPSPLSPMTLLVTAKELNLIASP